METSKVTENPYLAARREWNERYGEFVKNAAMWKLMAALAMGIALVATAGAVYIGSQSKLVPYVVGIDDLGRVTSAGIPGQKAIDERVIISTLAEWISWHRSVVSDPAVQELFVLKTYAFLIQGSSAKGSIDEWYKSDANNPYQRMASVTVTADVQSVLPMSSKTYQVDWRETVKNKGGVVIGQHNFRGLLTIEIPGVDPALLLRNPLGIYIQSISIQKI